METNDIVIEQVTEFSPETADDIRMLVKQLVSNYKLFTDDDLKEILQSPQSFLFIARDVSSKRAAGMIMAMIYRIPDSKKAYLDDLIVDENFRKRGIATLLINKAIEAAQEQNASYVQLTSHPKRTAGNHLYEKLGFQKRETNVYRLEIGHE